MAAAYRALSDADAAAVGERVCAIVRDGDKLMARAAKRVFEELVEGSPGGGDGVGSVERLIDLAWHSGGFEWAGGPTLLERFGPRPALIEFLAARWKYIAGESLGVAELVLRVAYLARWRHLLVAIAHRLEASDRLAMARAYVVALETPQGESAVLAVGGVAAARAELCWALAVPLWLDDDGTGATAPLVEAASTVLGVEKVWLKTRSRSSSREPFVQLADRLYELTNGSNFLASSAAARARALAS